jgi:protein-tyrosine phosphatase
MIDLHCHMLPGIDDGARNMEDALAMARLAIGEGTTSVVLTPHVFDGVYKNPLSEVLSVFHAFKFAIQEAGLPLNLHLGGEVHMSEHIPDLLERGELPFVGQYNQEKIMLLEMPHGFVPAGAVKFVEWLRSKKIRPLIAHPERNKDVMRSPEKLNPFVALGCGLQVTAGSLTGHFGAQAQRLSWQILERNLCFCVASDGHNQGARPPVLRSAYEAVANRLGVEKADNLFRSNALSILRRIDVKSEG